MFLWMDDLHRCGILSQVLEGSLGAEVGRGFRLSATGHLGAAHLHSCEDQAFVPRAH